MAIANIRTHISLLMRYRSLENEYAKLDLGLLLKPHSMTKIGNINGNEIHSNSSSKYNILLSSDSIGKIVLHITMYMTYLSFLNPGSFRFHA